MRFIIILCLSFLLSGVVQAQSEAPFGVRNYGFFNGMASNQMNLKGGKGTNKGSGFLAFIDLQYRNQAFSLNPPKADNTNNRFYTGLEAAVNIPIRSYFLSGRYSMYLPNQHHYEFHPFYGDEREGSEILSTYSINVNKFFVFGTGRKQQIFFFQLGAETYTLKYKYDKDDDDDPTKFVSPKFSYDALSVGFGHHFKGPWYWEFRYSYVQDEVSNYTLGLGYRIFIKK